MRVILPPASLSAVTPVCVQAFDREWTFTPWFEPVWRPDGRLMALDMLSRSAGRETGKPTLPAWFFARLPPREQLRLLCWQLDILGRMMPWCASREVVVSLSITRPLAMLVLAEPGVQETIQTLAPVLRPVISERTLPPGREVLSAPFLQGLLTLVPLWLDDFGAGSGGLSWLMSGLFESVKTDRGLLSELHVHPGGARFLAALSNLAGEGGTQLIAGGVSDPQLLAFSHEGQVTACQGALWPGVTAEQLHMLPDRCPGLAYGVSPASGEHHA
ncbi:EAL domain-containing protein [Citrobacter meridianamericanus]|uniref:EAL domain-containing protein n=1 Tax=Citrobacter meridianamericanus TaxID=2894201 RepID=A0ABT1BFP5_9ENTR|nr:EAL domain-containing protein [Citrobacter meridianamericanus]MCO5784617.1 EAL domain-containing protein [Citrobacter meridianamericanus]